MFLYEKPMVSFSPDQDLRGYEGYFLEQPIARYRAIEELAITAKSSDIDQLGQYIQQALDRGGAHIPAIRDRDIPHFGQAATVAVDQIQTLLSQPVSDATEREGR